MRRTILIATAVIAIIAIRSRPVSYWEFDETLFSQALHSYNPVAHTPPPPGYPLFIFVARLFRMVFPTDLSALVALSVAATIVGFVLLSVGEGVVGALLFYLSPVMLVHATMPISEAGALALLAAALYFARNSPPAFAAFAALTVGWRPQFSIFVVPLLFAVLWAGKRRVVLSLAIFTAVCLVWLVPLTVAVGGVDKLIAFETGQAQYLAQHDAEASRQGWSAASILVHFIAHPWGPRVMAIPILILAAIGAWTRRRDRFAIAIGFAGAVYLVVALAVMDPADGVRYAIPFVLVIALAAGAGVARLPVNAYAAVMAFAAGSIMYVSSFVTQRATVASPIARAIESVPWNARVGYELSLWPQATYHFGPRAQRIDYSMQQVFDRPRTPLYVLMNGPSDVPNAKTFAWENSDAYWNLTRNLYRVISLVPFGPERRYRVIRGVHLIERESDAIRRVARAETSPHVWMWLDGDAAFEIPNADGVELQLRLPQAFPLGENRVTVIVDGQAVRTIVVKRGEEVRAILDFPAAARTLELRSASAVVPPGDSRRVAVQLRDLVFRLPDANAKRRAA